MNYHEKIVGDIEGHDVQGIKNCFENGVNPNYFFEGRPLIYTMIDMYLRSPNFKKCIQLFVDFGLIFEDEILLAVLLDNNEKLIAELKKDPEKIHKKYNFTCTFTPLFKVSLLHICAEYNHVECAKVLIKSGLDVNIQAGFDENGFGGQTPVFHTVNQHNNNSLAMLKLLIAEKADLNITLKGIIWGNGYEWETFIPAVNPTSYAMMGLLRQFQRTEADIYEIVCLLMEASFGQKFLPQNVPNKYLMS
jgi:Ankyrin repeats (many copies)